MKATLDRKCLSAAALHRVFRLQESRMPIGFLPLMTSKIPAALTREFFSEAP
jgi:hypothetical protein